MQSSASADYGQEGKKRAHTMATATLPRPLHISNPPNLYIVTNPVKDAAIDDDRNYRDVRLPDGKDAPPRDSQVWANERASFLLSEMATDVPTIDTILNYRKEDPKLMSSTERETHAQNARTARRNVLHGLYDLQAAQIEDLVNQQLSQKALDPRTRLGESDYQAWFDKQMRELLRQQSDTTTQLLDAGLIDDMRFLSKSQFAGGSTTSASRPAREWNPPSGPKGRDAQRSVPSGSVMRPSSSSAGRTSLQRVDVAGSTASSEPKEFVFRPSAPQRGDAAESTTAAASPRVSEHTVQWRTSNEGSPSSHAHRSITGYDPIPVTQGQFEALDRDQKLYVTRFLFDNQKNPQNKRYDPEDVKKLEWEFKHNEDFRKTLAIWNMRRGSSDPRLRK